MKSVFYLLFLLAIACVGCKKDNHSSNPPNNTDPVWLVYNKNNAPLPHNQINALAIDQQDIKWIGTAEGLCKLKQSTWTIYDMGNSPLPSSFVRTIAVEKDGMIWVGTDKGLASYDGTEWKVYTKANSVMTDNGIMCIAYDAVRQCTWVATEKELIRIDGSNNWQRFDAIEDDLILSMAVDNKGALWLGTFHHFSFRGRIRKFSDNQWTSFHLDQMGYASTFPYSLAIDKQNKLFAVLTGTSVKSVICFSGSSWQEIPGPPEAAGLKALLLDQDKVWVGGNALSLFGSTQWSIVSLPGGVSGIQAMALDSKQKKWLGTIDGGVVVYK